MQVGYFKCTLGVVSSRPETSSAHLGCTDLGERQAGHFKCTLGVVSSKLDTSGAHMKASRPFTVFHALPDMMLKVLFGTLTLGPFSIACRRADLVKTWSHWPATMKGS